MDITPINIEEDQGLPEGSIETVSPGQWYWVADGDEPWLGCVVNVGSNYAELRGVFSQHVRVHFDNFDDICKLEVDWRGVVNSHVDRCRLTIKEKLEAVKRLISDLRVGQRVSITGPSNESSQSLAVVSQKEDTVKKYKQDLILAKEKTLPKLHEGIKEASEELAHWLSAETLPFTATKFEMEESIERVSDRIFTVELYAGLVEGVKKVRNGKPAPIDSKLHVMQYRCYMDEECLASYTAGGIECRSIMDFDKWLAKKENFERILPFPRTIVAFRVRRNVKEREWDGTIMSLFLKFDLEKADKRTFLYIRNGGQLFRLNTDIDFSFKIFPDKEDFDFSKMFWAKVFAGRVNPENIITDDAYQQKLAYEKEREVKAKQWKKTHPRKDWWHNPFEHFSRESDDYHPLNRSSVYYDDIAKAITEQINAYNRIAVILQGLYDRSLILHPHPPVRLWTPDGFAAAVNLVYESNTLHCGEAPDFEAYRARLNSTFKAGSISIGQEDVWLRREAVREIARRQNDWRRGYNHYDLTLEHYRPYNDPGPGLIGKVIEIKDGLVVFKWLRPRRNARFSEELHIPDSIDIPPEKLLNITAYKPGDFRQFYQDRRTRMEYLKWAPLLLAAEEWHAGRRKWRF